MKVNIHLHHGGPPPLYLGEGRSWDWGGGEVARRPEDPILVHLLSVPNNGSDTSFYKRSYLQYNYPNRCYFPGIYHASSTAGGLFLLQPLLIPKVQ